MKFLCLAALVLPALLSGQTPAQTATAVPDPPYNDSLFKPGASDDSPAIDIGMKFKIYGMRIVAPRIFIGTAFAAGIQQWQNSPGKYGRTAEGYGKRYGTDYARIGIRETVGFGLDSALHLDPRVFRAPEGTSTGGRLRHAVSQVVIAHTDAGGRNFAYGGVLSAFVAGEAGSLWLPRRSDGRFGDGLVYAGILLAGDAGRNVFREFWPDIRRKMRHK